MRSIGFCFLMRELLLAMSRADGAAREAGKVREGGGGGGGAFGGGGGAFGGDKVA